MLRRSNPESVSPSSCVRRTRLALAALAATLASCGGGSSGDDPGPVFTVRTTEVAVAAGTPLAVGGSRLAFLADEAANGAADFNGDGDEIDSIAYVVNTTSRVETNLGVAARELAWLGDQLFLVVDESFDGKDWGGAPGTTERVLLRWSAALGMPVFVDVLSTAGPRALVTVGDLLFYASGEAPVGATTSSLRVLELADPGDPHEVLTDDLVGALSPRILGADGGVVFLALDETVEGRILNDDGDTGDGAVLALLDGEGTLVGMGYSADVLSTRLALADAGAPLRARDLTGGGRAVGFLVNEAAQGQTNLNLFDGNTLAASWYPPQCTAPQADSDALDDILHYVLFDLWQSDPVANPPVNTGIAGAERVVMTGAAVGTLSPEGAQGTCRLNGDLDTTDTLFRWIRFGQAPVTDAALLLAVDVALAGPAQGISELSGRFVVQVDEAADGRDWDGAPGTNRKLLGWLDPTAATLAWVFDTQPSSSAGVYATATWLAEQPGRTRLGVALAESSNDSNLNSDADKLDSVPTFPRIDTSGAPRLVFPGIAFAVQQNNAGISVVNGWAFYRISEDEDDDDWNGDLDQNDFVLLATNLGTGQTIYLGGLNNLPRLAAEAQADGGGGAAAFIASEAITGDLNGDSDAADFVVRYVTF